MYDTSVPLARPVTSYDERIVVKQYDSIYVLRVSGKGDAKGSANQLDVLRHYDTDVDVARFLSLFDVRMMKASDPEGARLRRLWQSTYGLTILSREGRRDFLGLKVAFGRSVFILYASTAAQMDEDNGNAFTRHVCEAISDPAFNGQGDPAFLSRRERGRFDLGKHPAVVYAFDPTRFVRTMQSANVLYSTAERWAVAFEAKDIHIDPQLGQHQQMMWTTLAFGSQMEAEIGKLRRFVGLMNKARDGLWPYRAGAAPLGAQIAKIDGRRVLRADQTQIAAVQALVDLGGNPRISDRKILECLSHEHGVVSRFPATQGAPVDELHSMAAHRFFVQRRLEGYRDGQYPLTFVGVAPNQLRAGSGHVLTRRWNGLDESGQPDRYGSITYHLPFPKPTVLGPDGQARQGWLAGLTDEEERSAWNRLIAVRGRDDKGRRLISALPDDVWESLTEQDRRHVRAARLRAGEKAAGGRAGTRAVMAVIRPYRADGSATGVRTYLRAQGRAGSADGYCQLRVETRAPAHPQAGISRHPDRTRLAAAFREKDLTAAAAALITDAVRTLLEGESTLGRHVLTLPSDIAEHMESDAARGRENAAEARRDAALTTATGSDMYLARLIGGREAPEEQIASVQRQSAVAWAEHAAACADLAALKSAPSRTPEKRLEPALDVSDPRDVVVGLRGVYGSGATPPLFLEALEALFPHGLRVEPGVDCLAWSLVGDVALPTATGETIMVHHLSAPVANIAGRAAGGHAGDRITAVLRRRLHDGQTLALAAQAGTYRDLAGLRRALTDHLRSGGAFPDHNLIQPALDCEIADATRVLWHHLNSSGAPRTSFEQHIVDVYTGAVRDPSRRAGRAPSWVYDPHVDRRLDQLTIIGSAADSRAGVLAAALGEALQTSNGYRNVLDASAPKVKVNGVYPAAVQRVPVDGSLDGWSGSGAMALPPEAKRISAIPCPWTDCAETQATALVPALEVLVLGTMVLCRRCQRAASPESHAMHERARAIRFPQAYLEWADRQQTRTGAVVRCAAATCTRDVGFGPGRTWRWDDSTEDRAWHDHRCRSGRHHVQPTPCQYLECEIDEGPGPGLISHSGRTRRRWHSRVCEFAEARRRRALNISFVACINPACTQDEGGGPGSIRQVGKRRTVHSEACRRASRSSTRTGQIRVWAAEHGFDVAALGRLPKAIMDAYEAQVDPRAR